MVERRRLGHPVRNARGSRDAAAHPYIETFHRGAADATGYRRSREVHEVRTFETRDVVQWLDDAGFSVEIADRFGAYALAPRRPAFFAIRHGR